MLQPCPIHLHRISLRIFVQVASSSGGISTVLAAQHPLVAAPDVVEMHPDFRSGHSCQNEASSSRVAARRSIASQIGPC